MSTELNNTLTEGGYYNSLQSQQELIRASITKECARYEKESGTVTTRQATEEELNKYKQLARVNNKKNEFLRRNF